VSAKTEAIHRAKKRAERKTLIKEVGKRYPDDRQKNIGNGFCNALKQDGRRCRQPAGMGTDHLGFGTCRFHGGFLPNHRKSALKQQAVLMGAPKDINPLDGLMWCIRLTAGEVQFCTEQIENLDKKHWTENTIAGKQLNMWAKERQSAVDRLAKFCKDALALGIAERSVRIAEQYGSSLARYTKGLLDDLQLTEEQMKRAPVIVRKHLMLLEGGLQTPSPDVKPLAAIPERTSHAS
jgi:hypothetical protein